MSEQKYRLRVAYDGTEYSGFQRQAKGERTIQGELEAALTTLIKRPVSIVGAGRTDAGVHALGQACHFEAETSIPIERFPLALNGELPPDIVVWQAEKVDRSFHAIRDALRKRYRYYIWSAQHKSPFWRRYSYHFWYPIEAEPMREAAEALLGEHDFTSFRASGGGASTSVRKIETLNVEVRGPFLEVVIEANGFLYKMVRNIVGTLIEVGAGRQPVDWVAGVLNARDRTEAGPTAPAHGLCLERVFYDERTGGTVAPEAGESAAFRRLWFL